jgi:cytochrome d ubiquinol oxidase subunit II
LSSGSRIAALMLTAYVVLDGFDFGAGALHLFVARTIRAPAGAGGHRPVLGRQRGVAARHGGALFVAFPRVLASGLSGFYFAIFLVLWALILRGISIEFRSHVDHRCGARVGRGLRGAQRAAAGPVRRGARQPRAGLPLDGTAGSRSRSSPTSPRGRPSGSSTGTACAPACSRWSSSPGTAPRSSSGKPTGRSGSRSRRAAGWLYGAVAVLWPLLTLGTWLVNAPMLAALPARPLAWLSVLLAVGGLLAVRLGLRGDRPLLAFLGSCAFVDGHAGGDGGVRVPGDAAGDRRRGPLPQRLQRERPGLEPRIALGWWVIGAPLAVAYFVVLFRIQSRQGSRGARPRRVLKQTPRSGRAASRGPSLAPRLSR